MAKKKIARTPKNAPESTETGDPLVEGGDSGQSIAIDSEAVSVRSEAISVGDDSNFDDPEQKPAIEDPATCDQCSWNGPRASLINDAKLNRPCYCPKCGSRVYHPVLDKNHGYRQFSQT